MTIKSTPSSERIKALMRQTTASVNTVSPTVAATPQPATRPPLPVRGKSDSLTVVKSDIDTQSDEMKARGSWNRITIRLTGAEIQKINDVVIATQQANRQSKVTTTDILRVALHRIKEGEALEASTLKKLREQDGRMRKNPTVRSS